MKIKKYLKPTLKEALEEIKNELGEEAIVLSTRVVPSTGKPNSIKMFEVVASIEEDHITKMTKKTADKISTHINTGFDSELQKLREKIFEAKHQENLKDTNFSTAKNEKVKVLSNKLESIKENLIQNEVQLSTVNKIIGQLRDQSEIINRTNLDNYLLSVLSSFIPTASFSLDKKKQTKLVSLVGPTGVGKTTCIAKLAVISKILHKLDIGLISLDTYRLGALDQLKIFSEVSKIDFLVAYDQVDLEKAVTKFKKKNLVFIDTAGRSQNNIQMLESTKRMLTAINVDEILLVLSSTNTSKNLLDAAKKFRLMNYSGFVFTKLDEAVTFGNILNLVEKFNSPIKFLTNGQVIPDDIIAADSEFVAKMIITGKYS
jgi:flagellar biosynthesis protein FlhF